MKKENMPSKNILDVYRLKSLPFDLGRFDVQRVGRETEWARLLQMVALARDSKSPIFGVLLGTYGAGKSFLLWQIAKELDPASKSKVLASRPIRLIDPEQRKDFLKSLVVRLFSRGIDVETQLAPVLAKAKLKPTDASAQFRPFVSLLLALTNKETAGVARRVLTGGRALKKEAEDAGIADAQQIKTNDDAASLLQSLQLLLKSAGIDVLSIMIDEVEYIEGLPKGQRTAVIDSLKHLWDQEVDFFSRGNVAAQLLMVLSATPTFWQEANAQILEEGGRGESAVGITPFFRRIRQSEIVEMPAELASEEARQLIVTRMSMARPGQTKEDIIPFTNDYVDYVYELSQGLPRQIIEICGVVITEAAQRKLKTINRAAAKEILRDLLISYEPIAKGDE